MIFTIFCDFQLCFKHAYFYIKDSHFILKVRHVHQVVIFAEKENVTNYQVKQGQALILFAHVLPEKWGNYVNEVLFCYTFLCPHFSVGHLDLPLSVHPSFRPSVLFCAACNSKSI
jgi:hypothetical protein